MEKFIEFLERNNAWENFERAFNERGGDLKGYKEACRTSKNKEISGAFTWAGTKEGHEYWSKLNDEWVEENTTLKEKLLSDD